MNHADCDHYWEKGWVVVEGIYDVDEVDSISQLAIEIKSAIRS